MVEVGDINTNLSMNFLQNTISLLILLLSVSIVNLEAQNVTVEGKIIDKISSETLPGASTMLLQKNDSTLYKFGVTNSEGKFNLKGAKPGEYILQVSFIGYNTYYKKIELKSETPLLNLGTISLTVKAEMLKGVEVVEEIIPMAIKGDTIEYDADAFKTQPEATVGDLLKKMPGVEVDKSGTVKAQGEEVKKVLIDGKEFFGDDTKMATENLPADMVKKVQVYDDMSEMSKMTGIDDGNRTKTINLKLKKDRKKGVFGNVNTGGGSTALATGDLNDETGLYNGKFNVNKFTEKMQLSTLGMLNNTNEQGFSYRDYINFVGGGVNAFAGGGGFGQLNTGGILIGGNTNDGFTKTAAGGANLNYDFTPASTFSINYFYNQADKDMNRTIERQNISDSSSFNTFQNEIQNQFDKNHRFNLKYKQQIDSTQDLTISGNLTYSEGTSISISNNKSTTNKGIFLNESNTNNSTVGENISGTGTITYGKRFQKKGRSVVTNFSAGSSSNEKKYNIFSSNSFAAIPPNLPFTNTTDQFQFENNDQFNYEGKISYNEPLGKGKYVELSYERKNYDNSYLKDFFDIISPNSEIFNTNLSLSYDNSFVYDNYGLNLRFAKGKSNFVVGGASQRSVLDGEIKSTATKINQTEWNLLPKAQWNYNFNTSTRFVFNYFTNVNQPTLQQLQPTLDNSNPLYLYQGNPDLNSEYRHTASLRVMSFSQFSFVNIFANITGSYTKDKITNAQSLNNQFIQTTTPINVDDDYFLSGYLYFGSPIRPLKAKINIRLNSSISRSILFINTQKNDLERLANGFDINLENRNKDVVDIKAGTKFSITNTTYSESTNLNQSFLSTVYYSELIINIKKTWTFSTELDYTQYSGDQFANNPDIPILQASLSKRFLKGNAGLLKLTVYDIFNENVGINRTSNSNYIEDERVNTLSRYFLISFTYKISRFGGKKKKEAETSN